MFVGWGWTEVVGVVSVIFIILCSRPYMSCFAFFRSAHEVGVSRRILVPTQLSFAVLTVVAMLYSKSVCPTVSVGVEPGLPDCIVERCFAFGSSCGGVVGARWSELANEYAVGIDRSFQLFGEILVGFRKCSVALGELGHDVAVRGCCQGKVAECRGDVKYRIRTVEVVG